MCQIGDWQSSTFVSERQGLAGWRWFGMEEYRGHRGKKVRLTALYEHGPRMTTFRYTRGLNTTAIASDHHGFWSYKTLGLARGRITPGRHRVLARVTVSGQVERHVNGYRSTGLKIEELYLTAKPLRWPLRVSRKEWETLIKRAAKTYKLKTVKPQSVPLYA